jgi:hypothetical protein
MSPRKDDRAFRRSVQEMISKPRPLTPQEKAKRTSFYAETDHDATPLDSFNARGSFGPAGGGTWRELP